MDPSWDDLRWFLVAAEAGSFSEAARRLQVEQSTVSRRIAALERALGGALFLRSRSGLTLTDKAQAIRPLAEEARWRIRELSELSNDARASGRVRLALTEMMALYGVAPHLPTLRTNHPGLQLELIISHQLSDLSRRDADIAVRFVRPQRGELVYKRVAELTFGVWAHRDLRSTSFDDLPWIEMQWGGLPAPEQDWARAHRKREPWLITPSAVTLMAAVRNGLGAAVMVGAVGEQHAELERRATPKPLNVRMPVYLVAHLASRHTPRVSALWSFLEGALPQPTMAGSSRARYTDEQADQDADT